jgi:hypothetical protein
MAFGFALHGEGLARPFAVELLPKSIESFLALQDVHAGRPRRFLFEGEVHALVAAVLPRAASLDALDGDAATRRRACAS